MVSKGRRELQIGIVGRYRRKVGVEGRKRGRLVPKDERKAGNRMVGWQQDGRYRRMVGVEGREGVTDMYRSKVGVE